MHKNLNLHVFVFVKVLEQSCINFLYPFFSWIRIGNENLPYCTLKYALKKGPNSSTLNSRLLGEILSWLIFFVCCVLEKNYKSVWRNHVKNPDDTVSLTDLAVQLFTVTSLVNIEIPTRIKIRVSSSRSNQIGQTLRPSIW